MTVFMADGGAGRVAGRAVGKVAGQVGKKETKVGPAPAKALPANAPDDTVKGMPNDLVERYLSALRQAQALAGECTQWGDVPVGAVVVDEAGKIIGTGQNQRERLHDPTAHAEVLALRAAGRAVGSWRLTEATLVVTLEPCAMCAGAAVLARVKRVVFGAWDPKAGAAGSVRDILRDSRLNHCPEVWGGLDEAACQAQLLAFFRATSPPSLGS